MPPAKALKTERTHEENQERAYIAASRRSDRSLEARVESARRASEIHKRRTGRSLRVTEQDVVNEEMYEEEDDDLPMQYRRLTAHLQTGSADFNRRLSAYLTNHVAMRSALDQAITNSYAQQYPNAPQFSHNQSVYPSPFQPKSPQSQWPLSFGQPYPTPGNPRFTPGYQQRRTSQPQTPNAPGFSPHMPNATSAPNNAASNSEAMQRHTSHSSHSASLSPVQQRTSVPQTPHAQDRNQDAQYGHTNANQHASPRQHHQNYPNVSDFSNISPYSMSLPMESQMLLSGALDPNDPMTSALMGGHDHAISPYNQGNQTFTKPQSFNQHPGGMSTTLAPSVLDMQPRHVDYSQNTSADAMPPTTVSQQSFDNSDFSKLQMFPSNQNSQGSGTVTPGLDAGWDAFINDTSWTESVT